MSARELRSLRGRGSPPKHAPGGRKRLQSNADEATPKRPKTTNNSEEEGSIEEEQPEKRPVKKAATKGKGKKGKQTRFVVYPYMRSHSRGLTSLQPFGRMTAAQRAAKDAIEDAKGAPDHLTR
jgi:hypothetical protein